MSATAVFLDRDGVLNELVPDPISGAPESPLRVEEVRLVEGAGAALARLQREGFTLACVSNQPAAAKGTVSIERLHAVHARVLELLAQLGVSLALTRLCLHHPAGVVAGLSGACSCRKPAPGMLLEVAAVLGLELPRAWMVGDTDADVGAGSSAGCRTALIDYPGSAHKRKECAHADIRAPDIGDAVAQILAAGGVGDSWAGETVAGRRKSAAK